MEGLEIKIGELTGEMKTFVTETGKKVADLGTETKGLKEAIEKIDGNQKNIQTQLDAVDGRLKDLGKKSEEPEVETPGLLLTKSEKFAEAAKSGLTREGFRMSFHGKSAFPREEKATTITNSGLGSGTSGIHMPQRMPGVLGLPMQELRLRDIMRVRQQTSGNSFDWVKQSARTNRPSPQIETSPKAQSDYAWTTESGVIRTIAHYTKVSRQALEDVPWLRGQIDNELRYGLKVKEEAELLSGDGTGEHLNGILTQASAFDTTFLSNSHGWTRLDMLRYAKLQVRQAGLATFAPTGMVLNPEDMAEIELIKDANGLYIVGDPITGVEVKYLWNLPVVESDSIAVGTFLVGAFATAAEIIDRMALSIGIAFENEDDYIRNLATILCEERLGFAVTRPTAFVKGTFTQSPA